jgi:hypothetical protein
LVAGTLLQQLRIIRMFAIEYSKVQVRDHGSATRCPDFNNKAVVKLG